MSDYRRLDVWQRSIELAVTVYSITASFPAAEKFGLVSQLRTAAVSISSLIAEGSGRVAARDQLHFLAEARGSLYEVESQLILSAELKFLDARELEEYLPAITRLKQLINGLPRHVARKDYRRTKAVLRATKTRK